MTLNDIQNLIPSLKNLLDQKIPFSLSYKLTKLMKQVDEIDTYYKTQLNELLQTYAEKDEEGNYKWNESDSEIMLKTDTAAEFHKKFTELRQVEVDEELPTFKAEEFEGVSITPSDLYPLMALIVEA